ncbi:MAG: hypothetical protein K6B14_03195 [Lachnospiraceae bacterium]|nr:hypothetical protein [Lachnospiraceae bacterium]
MLEEFSYSTLESDYNQFRDPIVQIFVNGIDMRENKGGVSISDVLVELTCGFEAGQASYSLYDCYNYSTTKFEFKKISNFVALGSQVKVALGYGNVTREVFRGIIVRVEFVVEDGEAPHVRVSAMDVKSIMMANHYHKRLTAQNYSGAIKEIFTQEVYMSMKGPTGVISDLSIGDTPDVFDVPNGTDSPDTIEMVGESDYEFIVRTAKKYNFEFFCVGGSVYFRSARADTSTLISLSNSTKVFGLNVAYDVTGLVSKVVVRGLDAGKAKVITGQSTNTNKISGKPMARSLISGSEYVYIDPTVTAISEAQRRSWYLSDNMAYRFGSLDMEIMGLPEIIPGRFINICDFGSTVSNEFYVTTVQHKMATTGRYTTRILGKAQKLALDLPGL